MIHSRAVEALTQQRDRFTELLSLLSPGKVGPMHDVIHESGGYEQRSCGLSGGVPKLT